MINSNYLNKEIIKLLKRELASRKMIRLNNFLDKREYNLLKNRIEKLRFNKIKIPDKFSYEETEERLAVPEFKEFLEKLLNKKISISIKIRKFSWKDYILIHDKEKSSGTKFLFYLCQGWNLESGGNKILIRENKSFAFPPEENSLIVFHKNYEDKEFLQYINHQAKNSFILIEGKAHFSKYNAKSR